MSANVAHAADWTEAPSSDWTGFYVGAHAGGGWANWAGDLTDGGTPNPSHWPGGDTSAAISGSGFLGGVQLGYNHQQDGVVWGLEGDIAASGISGSGVFSTIDFGPLDGNNNQQVFDKHIRTNIDWLGTIRGRVGVLVSPDTLFYGTGGVAVAGTSSRQNVIFDGGINPPDLHASGSASGTKWGWAAGVGLEHRLGNNWSVKAEYLYLGLGRVNYDYVGTHTGYPYGNTPGDPHTSDGFHTNLNLHAVRVGFNYSFGNP